MNAHIYIDSGKPLASKVSETLSDGSLVWNLVIGEREIPCASEKDCEEALILIKAAIERTKHNVLIL